MINESTLSQLAQYIELAPDCACYNLRKASRAVTQLFDEMLQPSGLRVTQFSILVVICILGSATISRLAETLVTDRTTLTRNLKPLEKQGLIKTVPGEDRRMRVISLTDEGRKALIAAFPLWKQAQSHIVERLGQQQWQELQNYLSLTVEIAQTN